MMLHKELTNGTQRIHKRKQALHIYFGYNSTKEGVLIYTHAKISLMIVLTRGDKNKYSSINLHCYHSWLDDEVAHEEDGSCW